MKKNLKNLFSEVLKEEHLDGWETVIEEASSILGLSKWEAITAKETLKGHERTFSEMGEKKLFSTMNLEKAM